jgi:hypothetical protein
MTPEQDRALQVFRAASKTLGTVHGKKAGGSENLYGEAYQALVRLGLVPQLKRKYRKVKHAS